MGSPFLGEMMQPMGNTFLNWVPLMDSAPDEELGMLVESAGTGAKALRRCHSMPADLGCQDPTDGSQPLRSRTSPHRSMQSAQIAEPNTDVTQTPTSSDLDSLREGLEPPPGQWEPPSPGSDPDCRLYRAPPKSGFQPQDYQRVGLEPPAGQWELPSPGSDTNCCLYRATPESGFQPQDYQCEGLEPPAGQWEPPSPGRDPDCCLYPVTPESGFQPQAKVQANPAGRRHLHARRPTQMATNTANYFELSDPNFRARHHQGASASSSMDQGAPMDPDREVTTLMIRNLPARFKQSELLAELDRWGFAGCYDFCYLPCTFNTHHGQGYAFVNMTSVEEAALLVLAWHRKHRFGDSSYRAPLIISAAELQGFEANVLRWNTPRLCRVQNPNFRPFVRDMREHTASSSVQMTS